MDYIFAAGAPKVQFLQAHPLPGVTAFWEKFARKDRTTSCMLEHKLAREDHTVLAIFFIPVHP